MALSEKTISRHNIKRAEVFAKYGLNTLDLNTVKPRFAGYSRLREEECILCGQKHLKWLFALHFAEPQGLVALAKIETGIDREGEVTLTPVGSKCINDWIDALPETQEKLELLKRWHVEVELMKGAMKAKIVEDLCEAAGYESPEKAAEAGYEIFNIYGGGSRDDYYAAYNAVGRREMRWFQKRIQQIRTKRATKPTAMRWLDDLAKMRAAIETRRAYEASLRAPTTAPEAPAAPAPATPAAPAMDPEDRKLLDRGAALFANHADKLYGDKQRKDFQEIASKTEAAGSFRSPRTRQYFADMVRKMDRAANGGK